MRCVLRFVLAAAFLVTAVRACRDLEAIVVQMTEANCISLAEHGLRCPALDGKT